MAVEENLAAEETGFVAVSRSVVSYAAELLAGMERKIIGEHNVRTAQRNAYEAMRADQARAQARADVDAMVAALAAGPRPRNNRPTRPRVSPAR